MANPEYRIHTKGNGTIVSTGVETNGIPNVTRGRSASFPFALTTNDLTVSGSYTVASGTEEVYDQVTVESGATLTVDGTLRCNNINSNGTVNVTGTLITQGSRLDLLRNFGDWAGNFSTSRMLNGIVRYEEAVPNKALVDSLLIGVEPSQELKDRDVVGVWGLVSVGNDERTNALTHQVYRLQVTVLVEYSEYSNHSEVENSLLA